jgi:anaerobic magnesium-protoporphyrin IX monomethyl ester cyclase
LLLINPAYEKFGGMLSRYVPVSIPVAIGILAAYMKKWGVKVSIIDEEIENLDADVLKAKMYTLPEPRIIGITVLTSQAKRAYQIGEMCKKIDPSCTVIMGGIHVTALPSEPLKRSSADIVIRGEGEEPLRKLYEALIKNEDWKNINGISYLDDKGDFISNPDGDLLEDIDDVPMFPYEIFSSPKYDRGFINSARGCPYKCDYCSQRLLTGLTYRWHSTKRVVENLRVLIENYGQESITFYDDNFSVNQKRVFDLCDRIVEAGLHKKCCFAIQTRADNLYEEIMPALKRANFTTVSMGMETGVERVAKEIVKDETVATHLEKVELCHKYGISVTLNMIYGFPSESRDDRRKSFEVVKKAGVGYTKFNNLIPYPGTGLYDIAKNKGRLFIGEAWDNFNSTLSATRSIFCATPLAYIPPGTSEFELKRDIVRANFGYILQWKIIKKIIFGEKGMGWVMLPPKWYLSPTELFSVAWTGISLAFNLACSFLPIFIGDWILSFVRRDASAEAPDDIKATSRTFNRSQAPQIPIKVET